MSDYQEWVGLFLYWCCVFNQLFLPSLCASNVTNRSDVLSYALFKCNWIAQTMRFKGSMQILVIRLLKPIVPMAGGLFEIGLPCFVKVLYGAAKINRKIIMKGFFFIYRL